jgi:hypothetical protein
LHHNWDRWLDTFSALVIYTSLVALSKDPGLWLALYNSKNLLFAKTDFFPPFKTEAWKQLAALRDPQVDELARKLQECCNPLWLSNRSLEATLDQSAVAPALPPVPADQRWWEQRPAPSAGTPAQGAAPASSSRPRPRQAPPPIWSAAPQAPAAPGSAAAPPAGPQAALPAPPPLSAPLGMAGTGPMPQLSQTMMPPSDTIWWTLPPAGQAQGPTGSRYQGSAPSAPMPRGYAPHAPVPTPPGPPMPGSPFPGSNAPAKRTQTSPAIGAVVLAFGILLLIIGAASNIPVVVIGGLVAGAWGMWRLVAASGKGSGPPR